MTPNDAPTTDTTSNVLRIKTRRPGQTVCDEPAEKDAACSGHLKHFSIAPKELVARIPKGHVLFRCQHCRQLYEGEPMGHVR